MRNENYATITQVANGFTVELKVTTPKKNDNDYHPFEYETYICASLDEALKKVEDYFTV